MKWKIKVDGKEHHSAIEDIMAQAVVMRAAKEESWPERDQLPLVIQSVILMIQWKVTD
jgi:hypothetical protein